MEHEAWRDGGDPKALREDVEEGRLLRQMEHRVEKGQLLSVDDHCFHFRKQG